MSFFLSDDGTLDTVVVCEHCYEEVRGDYATASEATSDSPGCEHCYHADSGCEQCYDAFVDELIQKAEDDHECTHFQPVLDEAHARGFEGSYLTANGITVVCRQCEALVINGIACHETGCPQAQHGRDDDGED